MTIDENMRKAVIKTRDMHKLVIDGVYKNYIDAKSKLGFRGICPLCIAAEFKCKNCWWMKYEGVICTKEKYLNPRKSIKRLNIWLKLYEEETKRGGVNEALHDQGKR